MRTRIHKEVYLFPRERSKGKPVWYVQLRDPATGKILTARSTGLTNETAAEKWAKQEYAKLEETARHPPVTLRDWASDFFDKKKCPHVTRLRLEGKHYSERVRENNYRNLRYLDGDPLMGKLVSEIKRSDVLALRDRIAKKCGRTRTAQTVMAAIRVVIREAMFRDLIDQDPFAGVGQIHYQKQPRKSLSSFEIFKVLAWSGWTDDLHWTGTLIAALTGLRAGEVRALQWQDLDKGKATIYVRRALSGDATEPDLPKWGKLRSCPYPVSLQRVLEPMRGDPAGWVLARGKGPIGYGKWSLSVKEAARACECPVTLHVLRHSLNTQLRGRGSDDEILRGAFGWSGPEIQENYTHREGYDYSALAAEIDGLLGGNHGE